MAVSILQGDGVEDFGCLGAVQQQPPCPSCTPVLDNELGHGHLSYSYPLCISEAVNKDKGMAVFVSLFSAPPYGSLKASRNAGVTRRLGVFVPVPLTLQLLHSAVKAFELGYALC